jgi:hypothetical protein
MKTIFKTLTVTTVFALAVSCGEKQEIKELGCGAEMSGYEVMDVKALGNTPFTYSEENRKLALEMTDMVNKALGTGEEIKIAFVKIDDKDFAAFVVGPADVAEVEKISCLLVNNDFGGRLPQNRKYIYYTEDHNTLVAAIKNKKQEE